MVVEVKKCAPKDGSGWFLQFRKCKTAIGEIAIQERGHDSIEITWMEVNTRQRNRGYGKKMIAELAKLFPGKTIYAWAIVPNARPFWNKLISAGMVHEDAQSG